MENPNSEDTSQDVCREANVRSFLQQSRKGSDSKETHLPALHEAIEEAVAGHENQDAIGDDLAGLQEGLPHRILPHTYNLVLVFNEALDCVYLERLGFAGHTQITDHCCISHLS